SAPAGSTASSPSSIESHEARAEADRARPMRGAGAKMRHRLTRVRRLVIKIGSRLLSEDPAGRPVAIAAEVAELRKRGITAVVVSSGAIALGRHALGMATRPTELPILQAAAAVGQGRLMQARERAFAPHGIPGAQIPLTHR